MDYLCIPMAVLGDVRKVSFYSQFLVRFATGFWNKSFGILKNEKGKILNKGEYGKGGTE